MRGYGAPDQSFVIVPHPMGGIKLDEIQAKAEKAFPEIITAAIKWQPSTTGVAAAKQPYPLDRLKVTGTADDVNALFTKNGWTDGLPIMPPTPDRVAAMLKGTTQKPDELIGIAPPRQGMVTVEMIATYLAMAGGKPEYMPIMIAAVQAVLDPKHEFNAATTTTNPCAPLLVINGPIVKELGIQNGTGALGPSPFSQPNATIGRTINLIMDVAGGSKAPTPDMSTLGFPGSYTMVLGENEEANPWSLLSEQMGFKKGANTVTVFEVRSFVNFNLHEPSTAEGLLHPMAKTIGTVTGLAENGFDCREATRELLVLSPEHAQTISKDGWDLNKVKTYLLETSRISMANFMIRNKDKKPECRADQTNPTVVMDAKAFMVMVAGGAGKHSVYLETTRYPPITREIIK